MIDSINLTFIPKTQEDFILYNSILSRYEYKRVRILKNLTKNIQLHISTKLKFIQFKIFYLNEYLSKEEITNEDYSKFKTEFSIFLESFNIPFDKLILARIDYKIDLKLSETNIQEYLYVFSKCRYKYYSSKKTVYYTKDGSKLESVYYKGSNLHLNLYDKQAQLKKKGILDSEFNNTLRIEMQIKTRLLSKYCREQGITKELLNFWDISVLQDFFSNILIQKFLYLGNYYCINAIEEKLKDIDFNLKEKIIRFCKSISETDISETLKTLSRPTTIKYIEELIKRNINPIPTKNIDFLLGIEEVLKTKYNKKPLRKSFPYIIIIKGNRSA